MAVTKVYSNRVVMFLIQASAFIITYPVNNAVDSESNESKKAVAWERAFIRLAKVCIWPILFHCSCFTETMLCYDLII